MSTPGGAPIHKDQLQARHIGTGDADMTKHEWVTNMHRDTLASHVGHYDQLSYYAVAVNESIGRVRLQFIEKMLQPCGPPPPPSTTAAATITPMTKDENNGSGDGK